MKTPITVVKLLKKTKKLLNVLINHFAYKSRLGFRVARKMILLSRTCNWLWSNKLSTLQSPQEEALKLLNWSNLICSSRALYFCGFNFAQTNFLLNEFQFSFSILFNLFQGQWEFHFKWQSLITDPILLISQWTHSTTTISRCRVQVMKQTSRHRIISCYNQRRQQRISIGREIWMGAVNGRLHPDVWTRRLWASTLATPAKPLAKQQQMTIY